MKPYGKELRKLKTASKTVGFFKADDFKDMGTRQDIANWCNRQLVERLTNKENKMGLGMRFIDGLLFGSGLIVAAAMFKVILHIGFCG
jgi:hypothetical protein